MDNLIDFKLSSDPVSSFVAWYNEAISVEQNPTAMTLSTIDFKNQRPDSRTVLFKGMMGGRLSFYTNYESTKGQEINENNEVCLLFYWHVSKRQVRIQGRAVKMSHEDSLMYFKSRDRQSQLASWVSQQSQTIANKTSLENNLKDAFKKFEGKEVPLPSNWGGYLVEPYEFEFFVYGDYRLNDRLVFKKINKVWEVTRLQP